MELTVVANQTETNDVGGMIFTGTHGQYRWLTSAEQYMGDMVRLCPDVLLGRYVTVTSIDSGSPWLTDAQRTGGWSLRSGMAYSPRLTRVEELLYQRDGNDSPGDDEWYLFRAAPTHLGEILAGNPFEKGNEPRPGRLLVFVNWAAFVLHDSGPTAQSITQMFWEQMGWVQPDVYISDGRDNLTFVCNDEALFRSVHERLNDAENKTES
jgi:hypothetical protein